MALQPGDFSPAAKVTKQGYVRNKDDVAEYDRELDAATFGGAQILSGSSDVELLPSTNDGRSYFIAARSVMDGPGGRKFLEQEVQSYTKTSTQKLTYSFTPETRVNAGDGAFVIGAHVTAPGVRLELVIGFVNVGPAVTTLTLVMTSGNSTAAAAAGLLKVAAQHMRTALP